MFVLSELRTVGYPWPEPVGFWWEDLCIGEKPFIREGWMEVSQAPGIGVELGDRVARAMLWGGDTYFKTP